MGYINPASRETTNDDEACMYALELLGGSVVSMTLKAAIELGLIDELLAADGHALTAEELAARLLRHSVGRQAEAAAASVDRMLRFLASYSVVRCTTELGPDGRAHRSYAAAPVCKWLTGNGGEGSMAPLGLLNLDKVFMESWYVYFCTGARAMHACIYFVCGMPSYHVNNTSAVLSLFPRYSHRSIKKVTFFYFPNLIICYLTNKLCNHKFKKVLKYNIMKIFFDIFNRISFYIILRNLFWSKLIWFNLTHSMMTLF